MIFMYVLLLVFMSDVYNTKFLSFRAIVFIIDSLTFQKEVKDVAEYVV